MGDANWPCIKFGGAHTALMKKYEGQDSEVYIEEA